jgi:hypothetical protein
VPPVIIAAEIPVASVVVMVVATAIVVVPSWNDDAASERGRNNRKHKNVFHVCFSFEYDQIGSGLGSGFRKLLTDKQEPKVDLSIRR